MGVVTHVLSSLGLDSPGPNNGAPAGSGGGQGGDDLLGGLGDDATGLGESLPVDLPAGLADLPADLGDIAPVDLPVDLSDVLPVELPTGVDEQLGDVTGSAEDPRENIEQARHTGDPDQPGDPALPGGSGDQGGEFDGSGEPAPAAPSVWAQMTGLDPTDHRGLEVQSGGWRPQPVGFATPNTQDWQPQAWQPGTLLGADPRTGLGGYLGELTRAVMTAAHTTGNFPPARLPGPAGGTAIALASGNGSGGPGGFGGWRSDPSHATGHDPDTGPAAAQGVDLDGAHAAAAHHERMSWLAAAHGFHDPHNSNPTGTNPDSSTNTGSGAGGQAWLTGNGMAVPTRDGDTLTLTPATHSPHARTTPDLAQGRYLIHIDNAQAPSAYQFELGMPAGTSAAPNATGGVDIVGAHGQTVQTIAAPWARDAHGRDLPTRFQISRSPDGATVLTQHVGFDDSTAFPVLADPDTGAAAAGSGGADAAEGAPRDGGDGAADEGAKGDGGGGAADEGAKGDGAEGEVVAEGDAAGAGAGAEGEGAEGEGADPAGAGENPDSPAAATDAETATNNAPTGPDTAAGGQPEAGKPAPAGAQQDPPPPVGGQQEPHTVSSTVDGQPVTISLTGAGTPLEDPAQDGPQGDQSGTGCTGPSCPPSPPGSPVGPPSGSPGCFGAICAPGATPQFDPGSTPGCFGAICTPGATPQIDPGSTPGCWGGICEPGATPSVTDDPPLAPPSGGDESGPAPVVEVQPDDNLTHLAERLGVPLQTLLDANQQPGGPLAGRDPNLIHPGERLNIPPDWDGTIHPRRGDTIPDLTRRFPRTTPTPAPGTPGGTTPPTPEDITAATEFYRQMSEKPGPIGKLLRDHPELIEALASYGPPRTAEDVIFAITAIPAADAPPGSRKAFERIEALKAALSSSTTPTADLQAFLDTLPPGPEREKLAGLFATHAPSQAWVSAGHLGEVDKKKLEWFIDDVLGYQPEPGTFGANLVAGLKNLVAGLPQGVLQGGIDLWTEVWNGDITQVADGPPRLTGETDEQYKTRTIPYTDSVIRTLNNVDQRWGSTFTHFNPDTDRINHDYYNDPVGTFLEDITPIAAITGAGGLARTIIRNPASTPDTPHHPAPDPANLINAPPHTPGTRTPSADLPAATNPGPPNATPELSPATRDRPAQRDDDNPGTTTTNPDNRPAGADDTPGRSGPDAPAHPDNAASPAMAGLTQAMHGHRLLRTEHLAAALGLTPTQLATLVADIPGYRLLGDPTTPRGSAIHHTRNIPANLEMRDRGDDPSSRPDPTDIPGTPAVPMFVEPRAEPRPTNPDPQRRDNTPTWPVFQEPGAEPRTHASAANTRPDPRPQREDTPPWPVFQEPGAEPRTHAPAAVSGTFVDPRAPASRSTHSAVGGSRSAFDVDEIPALPKTALSQYLGRSAVAEYVPQIATAIAEGWIRANVWIRSTRSPHNGSIFWSGYAEGNMDAAQAFAQKVDGKTVEMTRAGKWLDQRFPWDRLETLVGPDAAKMIWDAVSIRFARDASGEVNAFIKNMRDNPDFLRKTYMNIEKPELLRNPRVTKINEHE